MSLYEVNADRPIVALVSTPEAIWWHTSWERANAQMTMLRWLGYDAQVDAVH